LAASAAIFREDGKVLLAKRTKPPFKWSFPGGSLEPGESAAQAAIREAQEEVSVEIEIVAKAGEREMALPEAKQRYLISVFAASLVAGEPKTGPEASEIGWFDIEEIAALDTTEGLAESARKAERVFLAAKA
jgi:8-oxo-dGTP diphosphatase